MWKQDRADSLAFRLLRDRNGGMAVFAAFAIVATVAMTGLAVDAARGYLVKARLSQAIDAAALAGGRVFFDANRDDDVRMFFAANFPDDFLGATLTPLSISADTEAGTITVSASASIDTTLMRVLGHQKMTVAARSVVKRSDKGMELVLVMDNTGSMKANNRVGNMRSAAQELVDILYGNRTEIPNLWVALAPYTAAVNIGRQNVDWLEPGAIDALEYEFSESDIDDASNCQGSGTHWDDQHDVCTIGTPEVRSISHSACNGIGEWDSHDDVCVVSDAWKGCVEARGGPGGNPGNDVTDATPAEERFRPYFWEPWRGGGSSWEKVRYNAYLVDPHASVDESESTNTNSNDGRGPNLGCGPAITTWTDQRSAVEAAIAEMDSWHRGGTTTNLGLVWGWRLLSPKWRGLWGNPDLPLDYDEPLMDKVVVILTDGANQAYAGHAPSGDSDYTAYQRVNAGRLGTGSVNGARVALNNRTTAICEDMKELGIIIYTILFEVSNNSAGDDIRQVFESCASTPGHYFDADDGADLTQAFRTIGNELSNLRIAE